MPLREALRHRLEVPFGLDARSPARLIMLTKMRALPWQDVFEGVHTCTEDETLASLFQTIAKSSFHRCVPALGRPTARVAHRCGWACRRSGWSLWTTRSGSRGSSRFPTFLGSCCCDTLYRIRRKSKVKKGGSFALALLAAVVQDKLGRHRDRRGPFRLALKLDQVVQMHLALRKVRGQRGRGLSRTYRGTARAGAGKRTLLGVCTTLPT